MNKSHHPKAILPQLLLLLSLGCSEDPASEQPFREDEVTPQLEPSLEGALRTLDSDDIVITYDERSSSMEVGVDLNQFAELARGFTVEMNVEVKLPDGTVARHELDWTSGEDLEVPRIAVQDADRGRYEATVTSLAVDGQAILDAPGPHQSMELLEEGSPAAQEREVRAPDGGVKGWWQCTKGGTKHGTPGDDTLLGFGKKTKDILIGYAGDDALKSGRCTDTLYGGEGNDALWGGTGFDVCYGGPGDDQFFECEAVFQN